VKLAVIISGKELRADAVKVYVERQKKHRNGVWQDYRFPKESKDKMEMLIVEQARKLRKSVIEKYKK
jgi:hypothetical protein